MKLKTIMPFKVEVLEDERVNYFVQNCPALVNSKGEVNLLSEGQTTPFLPHHTNCCIRTAEGDEQTCWERQYNEYRT